MKSWLLGCSFSLKNLKYWYFSHEIGHFSHGKIKPRTFFRPQNTNSQFVLQLVKSYGIMKPDQKTSLKVLLYIHTQRINDTIKFMSPLEFNNSIFRYLPLRMKVYTEFKIATWLRMVIIHGIGDILAICFLNLNYKAIIEQFLKKVTTSGF